MPRPVHEPRFIIQLRFADGRPARYIKRTSDGLASKPKSGDATLYDGGGTNLDDDVVAAQEKYAPCLVYVCDLQTGTAKFSQNKGI